MRCYRQQRKFYKGVVLYRLEKYSEYGAQAFEWKHITTNLVTNYDYQLPSARPRINNQICFYHSGSTVLWLRIYLCGDKLSIRLWTQISKTNDQSRKNAFFNSRRVFGFLENVFKHPPVVSNPRPAHRGIQKKHKTYPQLARYLRGLVPLPPCWLHHLAPSQPRHMTPKKQLI